MMKIATLVVVTAVVVLSVCLLLGCVITKPTDGGGKLLCRGVVTGIPDRYSNEVDSLLVTLLSPRGKLTRQFRLRPGPQDGTASFKISNGDLQQLFAGVVLNDQDSIRLAVDVLVHAAIYARNRYDSTRIIVDSVRLYSHNLDMGCDSILREFRNLGDPTAFSFEKSLVRIGSPAQTMRIGAPTGGNREVVFMVVETPLTISLECEIQPDSLSGKLLRPD